MNKIKSKILVLVEGEKTDVKLMRHLLNVYGIDNNHEIVSYNTNIYTLYNEMFSDNDPESFDILQILRTHENNIEKKKLFDAYYSDILLIFDLDPQDTQFSPEKILRMMEYFVESSDMGKLYINYPMVESFYHMKSIPDEMYNTYVVTLDELKNKSYKTRVSLENRNHDYRKFAVDRKECTIVIKQNIEKAHLLTNTCAASVVDAAESHNILLAQLKKMCEEGEIGVLCTCGFYISDYNPKLLE